MRRLLLVILLVKCFQVSAQIDSLKPKTINFNTDSTMKLASNDSANELKQGKYWAMGAIAFTSIVVYLLFNVRSEK